VTRYTTQKTFAAGACSICLRLQGNSLPVEQGAHLITIRSQGCSGWLPGLAGTRSPTLGEEPGIEVVVLGRPDQKLNKVMWLPEPTLSALYPLALGSGAGKVEVRFVKALLPVQHDCPEQWLRDRLLRLCDIVDTAFCAADEMQNLTVLDALQSAGLLLGHDHNALIAGPADKGDRICNEELGYWDEEMKLNVRCGASMDGQVRQDFPLYSGLDGQ